MGKDMTAGREAYRASDWYDADAIDALNRRLEDYSTDYGTLKRQAEAEYAPQHSAELEALDARLSEQTAAARSEQAALRRGFDRQRRQVNERYDRSAASLNSALNARGLGRSSLAAVQGAYLEGQRGQALSELDQSEADEVGAINSRIARLTEETARARQSSAASYAQQLDRRIDQLRTANQTAAVGLQLQIAALQRQGYEAWQNWLLKERAQSLDEAEFRQKYGLNETGGAPAAARSSAANGAAGAKTAAAGTDGGKKLLSGLIRSAAAGIRTAASSLSGAVKKNASARAASQDRRITSTKVKQL